MLRPRSRSSSCTTGCCTERTVPGFTIQSQQKNTKVSTPPSAGSQRQRTPPSTTFRKFYDRGDFPLIVEHGGSRGNRIAWKTDLQLLDYHYYLPLFFDGLSETQYPYCLLAKQGICDMVEHGGQRILPLLPLLVPPIRKALNTRNGYVLSTTLRILQTMVKSVDGMGEALVAHYRQILPVLNLFKNRNMNTGDRIVYGQLRQENLGDLIQETLELLEQSGGDDAYYHIKYMIPTYESCLGKSCNRTAVPGPDGN